MCRRLLWILTLVLALMLPGFKSLAQKITISAQNSELEDIFKQIENQSSYTFIFNTIILEKAKPVTVNITNGNIHQVLEQCLQGQDLIYTILKNNIIIKEKKREISLAPQEVISVYGTVYNEKGNGFSGVRISIKNTSISALSDYSGNYRINLPDNTTNIVLSFDILGYQKQEIKLKDDYHINVNLLPDLKALEEVIVVGYGETSKRDLTGSVGMAKVNEITKAPVKSFDDAFAGRIAGVQVTSPDGQPGASSIILIRGGNSVTQENSPLYVIDGFPIEDYNINTISPEDIETIEVLKDASSTAIYGARASNGVIIVTTKKGMNGKPVFAFSNYFGIQQNTSKIELMNPYEFVKYQMEMDSALAGSIYLKDGKTLESYKGFKGIDWQEQLFRPAPVQNYYLSVRGGNKDTKYAISGSAYDQKGTVIASGFRRYQGRFVLDTEPGRKFKIGLNTNFSSLLSYGTPFTGSRTTYLNLLINAWQYRPTDGSLSNDKLLNELRDPAVSSSTNYQWNPVVSATNELRDRFYNQLTSNFNTQYDISQELKFKFFAGINLNRQRNDVFNNSRTRLGSADSPLGIRGVNGSVTFIDRINYAVENTLSYKKSFYKKHFLTLLSGFTMQGNTFSSFGSAAIRIPNEDLGLSGLSQGVPFDVISEKSENTLASFLGRINYSYKSKYLLTASLRADGSSKFTAKNKWAYFPSGAFAWNMTEERFMRHFRFLSESKIRLSYGLTGNNRVTDYAYYASVEQGGGNSYAPGGQYISGSYVSTLGNPDLKWESTAEINAGFDLGFDNQRFSFSGDIYRKRTTDLLLYAQLPTSSGYANAFQNIGSVENKGLELSFYSANVRGAKFSWNTNFNIAFNRIKLLGLAKNQAELLTQVRWNSGNDYAQNPAFIARLGHPVAMFYGYVWDGNYQYSDFNETSPGTYVLKDEVPNNGNPRASIRPGDIKYKDLNKDLQVDINDRTAIGDPNPAFTGGFSNNFTYKNLDLHLFFQFVYGNELMNVNRYLMEGGLNELGANQFASYQNRWTPENPTNEHFRTRGWGPFVYSSRVIEDGSYLRLKTLNVGYKISNSFTEKISIRNFRIYLAAQNLFTWTNYSGNDPEVSVYNSALTPGMDYSSYPRAKVLTLGLDVTF